MSPENNNPAGGRAGATPRDAPWHRNDADRLAHELNNLLDGSLRNVALAIATLDPGAAQPESDPSGGDDEQVLTKLNAANGALRQMASLIRQWQGASQSPPPTHARLGEAVEHAVQLIEPAAAARGVAVDVRVSDEAAAAEAGRLFAVILNAVRNSVEAFTDQRDPRVEVSVRIVDDAVELSVTDNGPGIDPGLLDGDGRFRFGRSGRPDGHGLGLTLSRDIVTDAGGTLELSDHRPRGARLTARTPLRRSHG